MHVGEGDAGFLEDRAFGKDARATAAALGTDPFVGPKMRRAILGFESGADTILQREQVGANGGKIGSGGHGATAKGKLNAKHG